MLLAHPAVLSQLLTEYDSLTALNAQEGGPEAQRRLEDLMYTLCVTTGTKDIDSALVAARHRLPGARPFDDSVLGDMVQRVPRADADAEASTPLESEAGSGDVLVIPSPQAEAAHGPVIAAELPPAAGLVADPA